MKPIQMSPFKTTIPSLSSGMPVFNHTPLLVQTIHDHRISDTHWHDYLQIWYTVSGEYAHVINGKRIVQKAGSIALIFPYTVHSIDSSASDLSTLDAISISIKKGEFEKKCIPFLSHSYNIASFDSFYLSPSITISGKQKEVADLICHDLLAESKKGTAAFTTKMFSAIARFLEICVSSSDQAVSKKEIFAIKEKAECIDAAMSYMLKHKTENVTIENLTNAALMSRRIFTDTFNKTVGRTCHSYLMTLKLGVALEYLRYTTMSIAEIAETSGFANASHLYRNCMAFFGMSPLEMRRACGNWAREYGDELFKRSIASSLWSGLITEQDLELHEISLTL